MARRTASPREEAIARAGVGCCALAEGDAAGGAAALRAARELFEQIGAPEAVALALRGASRPRPGRDGMMRVAGDRPGPPGAAAGRPRARLVTGTTVTSRPLASWVILVTGVSGLRRPLRCPPACS